VHFCLQPYYIFTLLLLPCIIILFLHLLSTNHKCTQPCYFPLLYKLVAQKVKMDMKNDLTRNFRLAQPQLQFLWCLEPSVVLLHEKVILILRDKEAYAKEAFCTPPHLNVGPTQSHSDGHPFGYFPRPLHTLLSSLGCGEPPLFIRTLR
jgi:hypothetical protein